MDAPTATLVAASVAATASILGVFVSGYVAYINAKRPANLKIMEFRRDWIENIRMKIAEIASLRFSYDEISEDISSISDKSTSEYSSLRSERLRIMRDMGRSLSFVQLCLNPKEEEHAELQSKIEFLVRGSKEEHEAAKRAGTFGVLPASRKVLKKEWDRLKAEG